MAPVDFEKTLRVSVPKGSAGDAAGYFARRRAGLLLYGMPFDYERLSHMGEVEVVVQRSGGPDLSGLDSSVVRGIMRNIIGVPAVLEVKHDALKQFGLVPFDGEVVMGFALNYVVRYGALGKKCVGGNVLIFDINGVKEGNAHPDLVCSLEFIITLYRQASHFFWV